MCSCQGSDEVLQMLRQIYGYAGGYGMRTLPWNSAGGKWFESALEFLAKVRVAKLARRLLASKSTAKFLDALDAHGCGRALCLS